MTTPRQPRLESSSTAQIRLTLGERKRAPVGPPLPHDAGLHWPLVSLMRFMPAWGKLKRVAHTLPYDGEIMRDTQLGRPLPAARWPGTKVRTRVIVGGKSPAFFHNGTRMLADLLPNAEHRVLEGQTHMVKAKMLGPALIDYFAGGWEVTTDRAQGLVLDGLGNATT